MQVLVVWACIYIFVGKHAVGENKVNMKYRLFFVLVIDEMTFLQRIGPT